MGYVVVNAIDTPEGVGPTVGACARQWPKKTVANTIAHVHSMAILPRTEKAIVETSCEASARGQRSAGAAVGTCRKLGRGSLKPHETPHTSESCALRGIR
eukprot:m.52486 g.52486  ORF g.52486 m.52486 type:complete len:100 (-) comp9105_c0_seq1:224-523(-)